MIVTRILWRVLVLFSLVAALANAGLPEISLSVFLCGLFIMGLDTWFDGQGW